VVPGSGGGEAPAQGQDCEQDGAGRGQWQPRHRGGRAPLHSKPPPATGSDAQSAMKGEHPHCPGAQGMSSLGMSSLGAAHSPESPCYLPELAVSEHAGGVGARSYEAAPSPSSEESPPRPPAPGKHDKAWTTGGLRTRATSSPSGCTMRSVQCDSDANDVMACFQILHGVVQ